VKDDNSTTQYTTGHTQAGGWAGAGVKRAPVSTLVHLLNLLEYLATKPREKQSTTKNMTRTGGQVGAGSRYEVSDVSSLLLVYQASRIM
jgi:hypothetical protein